MPTTAYILAGGNLGDREAYLQQALSLLEARVGRCLGQSKVYETTPWGVEGQPNYLNQVWTFESTLDAEALLHELQAVELALGRERSIRWAARTIDLDLLYFGELVCDTPQLTLPHPRLHQRRFTLIPLVELCPDFVHPVFGLSQRSLLQHCEDPEDVWEYSPIQSEL